MTQCKIKVSLGYKREIIVLHRGKKIKKLRKSYAEKINSKKDKKNDVFENAKFDMTNGYFLFEKKKYFTCHLFSAVLTAFFAY